jgi:hypothetical protein
MVIASFRVPQCGGASKRAPFPPKKTLLLFLTAIVGSREIIPYLLWTATNTVLFRGRLSPVKFRGCFSLVAATPIRHAQAGNLSPGCTQEHLTVWFLVYAVLLGNSQARAEVNRVRASCFTNRNNNNTSLYNKKCTISRDARCFERERLLCGVGQCDVVLISHLEMNSNDTKVIAPAGTTRRRFVVSPL